MIEKVPCKLSRFEKNYRTLYFCFGLFCYGELVFAYSAEGTFKVFGKFIERCAGSNAGLGQSFGGIVLPAADVANVSFHNSVCFFSGCLKILGFLW